MVRVPVGLTYICLAVDYNRSRTGLIEPGGKLLAVKTDDSVSWTLLDDSSYGKMVVQWREGGRRTFFKNWFVLPT